MADTNPDIASLEAKLALDRASLAEKIFARYGQSTSANAQADKSTTAKKKQGKEDATFQHRSPTLGLGAKPQARSNGAQQQTVGNLSIADARLKGRLSNKKAELGTANGKRKADDDSRDAADEDEEESRTSASKSKKKAGKADPFAPKPSKAGKQQQQQQAQRPATDVESETAKPAQKVQENGESPEKLTKSQRKKLNKKRKLEAEQSNGVAADTAAEELANAASQPMPAQAAFQTSQTLPDMDAATSSSAQGGLSDHQKQLRAKLQGSQFRQLNESLYTSASADSFRLAQEDPTRMQAYHEGFREQTKKWPQKPFEMIGDIIAEAIVASWGRLTSSNSGGSTKKGKGSAAAASQDTSIPPGAIIADLGAGEGPLSKYLSTHTTLTGTKSTLPSALRPRILAYDLLDTVDGIVRGADCSRIGGVPLPGSVDSGNGINERAMSTSKHHSVAVADVAVFCLSLMGTDWVGMILEARRILRSGGSLIIAEVTSRLASTEGFVELIEALGFKLDTDTSKADNNTHFVLFRFHKWTDAAASSKKAQEFESVEEARDADRQSEARLLAEGREVLKPCLYKRR